MFLNDLIVEIIKAKQNKDKGFTLIELLVVVIIVGILTAIAIPNLAKQVEKSRQTEAKVVLGNLNRAQQAYRFENGTFTNITNLSISITGKHYIYAISGSPSPEGVVHTATVINTFENSLKDYSSATGQTISGAFSAVICKQNTVDGSIAPIPATITSGIPSCTSGTTPVF